MISLKNIFILVIIALSFNSCKKTVTDPAEELAKAIFEQNILNKDFIVKLAVDNSSTDLTSDYDGFVFQLKKETYENGPLTAIKNGITYSGTWSCTENYGKLAINLPSTIAEFGFLTRSWRFTEKNLPLMKLAPWGLPDSSPIVLHMERIN